MPEQFAQGFVAFLFGNNMDRCAVIEAHGAVRNHQFPGLNSRDDGDSPGRRGPVTSLRFTTRAGSAVVLTTKANWLNPSWIRDSSEIMSRSCGGFCNTTVTSMPGFSLRCSLGSRALTITARVTGSTLESILATSPSTCWLSSSGAFAVIFIPGRRLLRKRAGTDISSFMMLSSSSVVTLFPGVIS